MTIVNSNIGSPLSQKQRIIWSLISKGFPIAAIAEKLDTSRQFVNQTKIASERKLSRNLMDLARVNDIQVTQVYHEKALLVGYHPRFKRKAIITYTSTHGLKIWFWYESPEEICDTEVLRKARSYLDDLAKEHNLTIENAEKIHPARLAEIIFEKLTSEEKT